MMKLGVGLINMPLKGKALEPSATHFLDLPQILTQNQQNKEFMKNLLLISLVFLSSQLNGQTYDFEDETIICQIGISRLSNDSLNVQVRIKNKSKQTIYFPLNIGNYIESNNNKIYLYIGWDQINTLNMLISLGPLLKDSILLFNYPIKFNKSSSSLIFIQLNYAIFKDIFSFLKTEDKRVQIYLNDYMIRMRWNEWSLPMDY